MLLYALYVFKKLINYYYNLDLREYKIGQTYEHRKKVRNLNCIGRLSF
jgi:hypothetical protein